MSETFPSLVWAGRTVFHAVFGSHDGGYDPHNERWQYWVMCDGGPKWNGEPRPSPAWVLVTVDAAARLGLRPCGRACADALGRLLEGGET
jgi:hypothetical protein